jgi:hypothetical protein
MTFQGEVKSRIHRALWSNLSNDDKTESAESNTKTSMFGLSVEIGKQCSKGVAGTLKKILILPINILDLNGLNLSAMFEKYTFRRHLLNQRQYSAREPLLKRKAQYS